MLYCYFVPLPYLTGRLINDCVACHNDNVSNPYQFHHIVYGCVFGAVAFSTLLYLNQMRFVKHVVKLLN
jgi:hypothetical protein